MKHPDYRLRPNKTADRFALIEAIRRLERLSGSSLKDYTYHSLGGPYLEDFRLLYEFCPDIGMVSIDDDEQTHKRQRFHLPCGNAKLTLQDMSSYITQYEPVEEKSVFWLDYTRLKYRCFEDFKALLAVVVEGSMVKITLRSEPMKYGISKEDRNTKIEEFRKEFENVMQNPSEKPPLKTLDFAWFLQRMIRVAAEQALPPSTISLTFIPVSSFYYRDSTWMFTLTGIVWQNNRKDEVEKAFADWEFANLTWDRPRLIDMPVLSTKERLHLQHLLPSSAATGRKLRQAMGYLIDDDISKTETALEQYAAFHRYSPYVLRGVP